MKWLETEIKNFKGQSTRRTPSIQECAECNNLSPKDTSGDLVIREGESLLYDEPNFSPSYFTKSANLGFEFLYISQFAKEVCVFFQTGTVTKRDPNATVASKNILLVALRPYYLNGNWVDGWQWLNRMIVTRINYASGYQIGLYSSERGGEDKWVGATIYNVTKSEYATITSNVTGAGDKVYITTDGWAVTDTVIVELNHFPETYLAGNFTAAYDEICFHKILNDLRIGFGGLENRLGMGIGYLKKYWQVISIPAGTLTTFNAVDQLTLNPYNTITDSDTYSATITIEASSTDRFTKEVFGDTVYLRMTAVLDGFQEFLVYETSSDVGEYPTFDILIRTKVKFATMNKRITSVRIYLAGKALTYLFIDEYFLSKSTVTTGSVANLSDCYSNWRLDEDGFLIYPSDIYTEGEFSPLYKAYHQTDWDNATQVMQDKLGYEPSLDYVKSWDRAMVGNGRTLVLNPYTSIREANKIFGSVITGSAAFAYDVITPDLYYDFDTRDGNDAINMESLSNQEILIAKQNSTQILDLYSSKVRETNLGAGLIAKNAMVNFGSHVAYPSEDDVFIVSPEGRVNITENTIRDAYRAMTDKSTFVATRDKDGQTYRLYWGANGNEYVYVQGFGWARYVGLRQEQTSSQYAIGADGCIYYTDYSSIYKIDASSIPNTVFSWKSVPIDISLMGENIKGTNRLLIGYIWLDYVYGDNTHGSTITAKLSLDDGALQTVATFSYAEQPYAMKKLTSGLNCKKFQLFLTGQSYSDDAVKCRIKSVGILWKPIEVGRWG